MEHNKSFLFNYQITEIKSFKVNLEDLAILLIKNNVVKGKVEPSIKTIIEDFGNRIDFYLIQLGFPEEIELDEYDYECLYDSVYNDLSAILQEKLHNQQ